MGIEVTIVTPATKSSHETFIIEVRGGDAALPILGGNTKSDNCVFNIRGCLKRAEECSSDLLMLCLFLIFFPPPFLPSRFLPPPTRFHLGCSRTGCSSSACPTCACATKTETKQLREELFVDQ